MDKYETFSSRIRAKILDFFITMFPLFLILVVVSSVFRELNIFRDSFNFFALSPLVVLVIYPIVMHTFCGQTFGKKLTNLKVIDVSEKPLIFGQAILRSLPQMAFLMFVILYMFQNSNNEKSISSTFFWYSVSFYFLFRITDHVCGNVLGKNRTLHDLLGKTVVIRTDV